MQATASYSTGCRSIVLALATFGLVATGGFPVTAHAEIYSWVDASGVVTYSNLSPPKDAKVTDVIHETPQSPAAMADAAHRSEVSALNDRIRLLELEMARAQRQVVDYPGAPTSPAGSACGPDGYGDCNPQWEPYYATGYLYGTRERGRRDLRADTRGHGHAPYPSRGPAPGAHFTHIAARAGVR